MRSSFGRGPRAAPGPAQSWRFWVVSGLLSASLVSTGRAEERTEEPIAEVALPASGDGKTLARQSFQAAIEALSQQDEERALGHFLRAQEIAPHPVVLLNIARTYERLGDLEQALLHYLLYLSCDDTSQERKALAEQAVLEVHTRLGQSGASAGRLRLTTQPTQANVRVDGTSMGWGARSLLLPLGSHEIEASAAGYHSKKQRVTVTEGYSHHLVLALSPRSALAQEPRAVVTPRPPAASALPPPARLQAPIASDSNRAARTWRTVALTLGGLGAVSGASAGGLVIWNEARFKRWKTDREEIVELPADTPDLTARQQASNQRGGSIETVDKIIWATAISGAALLAGGVTLLVWKPKNANVAWTGDGLLWTSCF